MVLPFGLLTAPSRGQGLSEGQETPRAPATRAPARDGRSRRWVKASPVAQCGGPGATVRSCGETAGRGSCSCGPFSYAAPPQVCVPPTPRPVYPQTVVSLPWEKADALTSPPHSLGSPLPPSSPGNLAAKHFTKCFFRSRPHNGRNRDRLSRESLGFYVDRWVRLHGQPGLHSGPPRAGRLGHRELPKLAGAPCSRKPGPLVRLSFYLQGTAAPRCDFVRSKGFSAKNLNTFKYENHEHVLSFIR